jgi:hypothetical protein
MRRGWTGALQELALLADPAKSLTVIMKDGRIHKSALRR